MKILWVRLSSLGDVVHTLPAINDLARWGMHIEVLTEASFADLYRAHPAVRAVHCTQFRNLKKKSLWALLAHAWSMRRLIKSQQYLAIIDSQGLWKSALLICGLAPQVMGGAAGSVRENGVWRLYRTRIHIDLSDNVIARYRHLARDCAKSLGVDPEMVATVAAQPPQFYPAINRAPADDKGVTPEKTVLLLHGVSAFREHKSLPIAHWQSITWRLRVEGWRVYTLWHGAEQGQEHRLAKLLEKSGAHIIAPQSLDQILQWFRGEAKNTLPKINAVISIDSGLGHLANACALPTLMVFAPTSARRFSSAHRQDQYALSAQYPCAPCGLRHCERNRESGEKTPPCWIQLSPDSIVSTFIAKVAQDFCQNT